MSFWDEVAETAEGLVTDPVGTVSDSVSEAGQAFEWAGNEFQEQFLQPEEGTFTPAPPQPEGPYDQTGVPTKPEIMDFVDGFEPPVRDAMAREFAKELYPGYAGYIDMSKDQWEQQKSAFGDDITIGGDGWGSETYTAFKWYDEIEMVLPTVEGMNYYRMQDPIGPDPETMIGEIALAGEARSGMLVGDLRTACEEALKFHDLDGISIPRRRTRACTRRSCRPRVTCRAPSPTSRHWVRTGKAMTPISFGSNMRDPSVRRLIGMPPSH
ncbi:hypothetical protein AB0K52_23620 [Glycomyces sp. NPDC049804]|uniref:hypothetical protein n=1 Tax=Glycomyces sp. NPDC049804 TaxID=3154363 RepID=UPI00341E5577